MGLKQLKELSSLEWLGLSVTQVTGTGLKELNLLTRLQELNLCFSKVTDNGLKGLKELKGLPERSWKVVALSAYALPDDRARASAAGFDGYITKPIDVRTFPAEVARYLGG